MMLIIELMSCLNGSEDGPSEDEELGYGFQKDMTTHGNFIHYLLRIWPE